MDPSDFADMVTAYLECMLWSTPTMSDEDCEDLTYDRAGCTVSDCTREVVALARRDCRGFLSVVADKSPEALAEVNADPSQAGHDLWLTAEGHGAGFWDGDWTNGRILTDCSRHFTIADEIYLTRQGKGASQRAAYNRRIRARKVA